jgi:hypothetical protein
MEIGWTSGADKNSRSFSRVSNGDCPADAAAPAGYQGDLAA